MDWTEAFIVFVLSHLVGDFLFQTDFQARNKRGGLGGDPVARRALLSHVATYTLAFVPALAWAASGVAAGVGLAALIGVPHMLIDDGRAVRDYLRRVKRVPGEPGMTVFVGTDQTLHLLCLFGAALLA